MKSDYVNAQAGESGCKLFRGGVIRSVGTGSDIESQEPDTFPVFKRQMAVLHLNKPMLAGRCVQQVGKIQDARVGCQFIDPDVLLHGQILLAVFCCDPIIWSAKMIAISGTIL